MLLPKAPILSTCEFQKPDLFDPDGELCKKTRTSRYPCKTNGFWRFLVSQTDQKSSQIMKNRGLKIDWFLVSILDHFFSLLGSQRLPNRLQNPPKTLPNRWRSSGKPGLLTDLVSKCPKMLSGDQKVTILEAKMISLSSKNDPKTIPELKVRPQNHSRAK